MYNSRDCFHKAIEKVDAFSATAGIDGLLHEIRSMYGLRHIAYFGLRIRSFLDEEPYVAATYPISWIEHYKERKFVTYDPVLRMGFDSLRPTDWKNLKNDCQRVQDFFGQADDFGIGRNGLTFSIRGHRLERALVSITSDLPDREWEAIKHCWIRDFQMLGIHLHETVLRLENICHNDFTLSKREIECLKWVSQGKTAYETAAILNLSTRTVRYYLENVRHKLNVTTVTHAVAKAITSNLI